MAAGGNSVNVDLGPGRLYYAPLGTAEPTSGSAAVPSAWKVIGYTEDGTQTETNITSENVEVAEEFDPIRVIQTARVTTLVAQLAEMTVSKLALAMGAGATRTDDATSFEFPAPDAQVGVMFLWDRDETPSVTNRRWLFRECYPSGTLTIANRKAPQKRLIPVNMTCVKPSTAASPVRVYPNATGQV